MVGQHVDLWPPAGLEPLLAGSSIRWLQDSVAALDAANNRVTLDDGSVLDFDWLSVNTGAVQDRQRLELLMPGVREHGLFVRPIEVFGTLWPRVVALAQTQALRLAVVGGGAALRGRNGGRHGDSCREF
jgi:NADH dehydrogenase FAD-containing subunit